VEANIFLMIFVLIILLAFSAFFSGSETALMAISRLRLRHISETEPKKARYVEKLLDKPERLIGAILLGNNLVNIAMTAIATALAISIWAEKGIVYVTIVLTIIILIFAEITPKVYAKYFNEKVSLITAPILTVILFVLSPFVNLVTYISNKLLLIIGVDVRKEKRPLMTEEVIKTCIKMGSEEGSISDEEKRMISRVFTLNDRTVGQVMVPKEKMVIFDAGSKVEEISKVILKTGHSRFPITEGPEADVTGFIHAKDLFKLIEERKPGSVRKIVRPAYFVSEDKKIDSLLRGFQSRKLHQAVVLDPEGKVTGLITLEDVLEQLVGSIQDEHD
jgi:putative hemolysin